MTSWAFLDHRTVGTPNRKRGSLANSPRQQQLAGVLAFCRLAVAPTAQGGDHSLIFLGTWGMSDKKTFSKNPKGGYRHHDY
jgi:hypothetical protein